MTYLEVVGDFQERGVGNNHDVDRISEREVESGAGTEAVSEYTNLGDALLQ